MKIAVVGAGIFGIECALRLSKEHEVHLFERNNDILSSASSINQFRIHRGYHYPRSSKTVEELSNSVDLFINDYKHCILENFEHYYCIAKDKSFVNRDWYIKFCKLHSLDFEEVELDLVNSNKMQLTIKVKESILDPYKLKKDCQIRLAGSSIVKHFNFNFSLSDYKDFDLIINCGYSGLNYCLPNDARKRYQFEVCEKILVKLPDQFKNKSIVVLDGPFFCLDPLSDTNLHLLGNVEHAVRYRNVGEYSFVPEEFRDKLNKGVVHCPEMSNFDKFINSMIGYIHDIEEAQYVGSMFTVRTVLPNVEKTDARPTIVEKIDNKIINVFSGKIDTAVRASLEVEKIIKCI